MNTAPPWLLKQQTIHAGLCLGLCRLFARLFLWLLTKLPLGPILLPQAPHYLYMLQLHTRNFNSVYSGLDWESTFVQNNLSSLALDWLQRATTAELSMSSTESAVTRQVDKRKPEPKPPQNLAHPDTHSYGTHDHERKRMIHVKAQSVVSLKPSHSSNCTEKRSQMCAARPQAWGLSKQIRACVSEFVSRH